MKPHVFFIVFFSLMLISCVSTKNTIKNIDDNAPYPLLKGNERFIITEYSTDPKYGVHKDYPINVYFRSTFNDTINPTRFLNALAGPKGERIAFKRLESCCPFPTSKSEIGAGFLDVYEVTWEGCKKPLLLYFNIYEKGKMMVPVGLTAKKED